MRRCLQKVCPVLLSAGFLFVLVVLAVSLRSISAQEVNSEEGAMNVVANDESQAANSQIAETPVVSPGTAGEDLITVSFKNADILEVAEVFSEKTGLNIVVGPDVKATVNIELNNLPWEKALDVILKNYNLTYKREEKLIRIMTLEQMKLEEEKVPLVTKIVPLNFARAEDIKSSFNSMLSGRGKIEINTRTNSIIITDLPENVVKIEEIANSLDSRTPQVMIEVLMADVKLTNEDQLGIQWKFARREALTAPYGKEAKVVVDQNIPLPSSTAATITFGQTILKATDFLATIRLWQEQKRVNILAHPVIMTLDNQSAHIELVEQIPYTQQTTSTESSSAISTTSFKEAGIKLDVTPHITTKNNFISLNVKIEQSFRSGYTPDNQPIIDSRKAETNLLVKDGETIVIGGLRKKEDTLTIDKVPFLGDIPLLGVFFRKKTSAITDIDLLIFVTSKIVIEPKLTEKEQKRLELFTSSPEEDKKFQVFEKKPVKKVKLKSVEKIMPLKEKPGKKKEEVFNLRPPA